MKAKIFILFLIYIFEFFSPIDTAYVNELNEKINNTYIQTSIPNLNKGFSEESIIRKLDYEPTNNIIIFCKYKNDQTCKLNESFISNNEISYNITKMPNSFLKIEIDFNTLLTDCNHFIRKAIINIDLIINIDVSNFDTSLVTDMQYMFERCTNLISLDLSNFNTSLVTDMKHMFEDCYSLISLNLSNLNTSLVTDMQFMFSGCYELLSLDVSNFDTSLVTDMTHMFEYFENEISLNLSNFNTSLVTNMEYMFYRNKFESIDVSNFDTSLVTNMEYMFDHCFNLKSIDVSSFNTSLVTNMEYMFYDCENLKLINLSNFNTSLVTNMERMFSCCWYAESFDVSNFNISLVTNKQLMFDQCEHLKSINLSNFITLSQDDNILELLYDKIYKPIFRLKTELYIYLRVLYGRRNNSC